MFVTRACPGRDTNEDSLALFPLADDRAVLAVADGVGGLPAGESASREALECLGRALAQTEPDTESLRAPILDGIEAANRALLEAGHGAATTLAVVEIHGGELRTYHIGDSAIWLLGQRGRFKLETVSHSPVGYAVESGMLDPTEALRHGARHLISNAVGSADMRIEIGSATRMAARDTLLLATDGILDNASTEEIAEIVRKGPLDEAAIALRDLCRGRMRSDADDHPSKPDDLALILFRR